MNYRQFGKTGWSVGEIGCGMWGIAEWSGANDFESETALDKAVENGCNFFDTAWSYGKGKSEQILGALVKRHSHKKLYVATKIPPKNGVFPPKPDALIDDVFPHDHILDYVDKSLKNLDCPIDLIQFHVWQDAWAHDPRWLEPLRMLKQQGKIKAVGVSVNRGDPENCLQTLQSGYVDAVQVVYNIFDQSPEDRLFPLCKDRGIAVIARVPLDEGMLTGKMTMETKFPNGDWRQNYFNPDNLKESIERVERLKSIVPENMTLPEMALRFIISNPVVSTTIPGMRNPNHVAANIDASRHGPLSPELLEELKQHRWTKKKK